jgi:tRNA(fMet)-specific endonuclease VapC
VGLVIDTSALVAVERGRVSAKSLESQLADTPVVLPAVVLAELLVGVHLADTPGGAAGRQARVAALAGRVPVVPFDREMAVRWAQLQAACLKAGTPAPSNELAVAATALELGFGVLAGPDGDAHFGRLPGVQVVCLM